VSELRHLVAGECRTWSQIVRDSVDDTGPPSSALEQLHLLTGLFHNKDFFSPVAYQTSHVSVACGAALQELNLVSVASRQVRVQKKGDNYPVVYLYLFLETFFLSTSFLSKIKNSLLKSPTLGVIYLGTEL